MRISPMPGVRFLKYSQLEDDSYHSLLISVLRGLAAVQVAAAHLRREFFPGLGGMVDPPEAYVILAFFTGYAHQAVIVFFVISGWLVGGSLLNKRTQPNAYKLYAIDRVSRLWTVLIPTFVVSLVIGTVTGVVNPHVVDFTVDNDFSAVSFIGNMFGLQNITVLPYGDNYPLWSLANESWYYLLFPLGMVCCASGNLALRVLAALCLVVSAVSLPFAIVLYFLFWLLGAAFSRIRIEGSANVRFGLFVLLAATATYYRLTGINDGLQTEAFVQDLVFSLTVVLFLSSMTFKINPASRYIKPVGNAAKIFSDFSFSLYVLHVPLLYLLLYLTARYDTSRLSPGNPFDYARYFAMLAAILVCAYLFYLLFESHTYRIRRILKAWLIPNPSSKLRAKSIAVE